METENIYLQTNIILYVTWGIFLFWIFLMPKKWHHNHHNNKKNPIESLLRQFTSGKINIQEYYEQKKNRSIKHQELKTNFHEKKT